MVIRHFLSWVETASVSDRAAAASALARAYLDREMSFEERCEAEAALTMLLDDPSEKVRLAIAEPFSLSRHAPLQIVTALAADQKEVAALVLVRSPLLTDLDLIDRIAAGDSEIQRFVAMRAQVSMAVSAAIAELGEAEACLELVENAGAEIAAVSFRRIAERHGASPMLREALLGDPRLPADCRHMLLVRIGDALRAAPLVRALIGEKRAEALTREACVRASLSIIETTPQSEHAALVEHLRLRGDLTAAFIVRAVAHGKIDFFGSILVAFSGQDEARVRSLLASGRDVAVKALLRRAGLPEGLHAVILRALEVWRDVANGRRIAGTQEVSWVMLRQLGAEPGREDAQPVEGSLVKLLKTIHLEALRDNARRHALQIAAAA